jgi:hypothetical protein
MAVTNQHTPITAIVLIFIGSCFVGYNEIATSTVTTLAIEDQRLIGTAVGFASAIRSTIASISSA